MVPIFYFVCKLKVKLFTKSEGQILELESSEIKKKDFFLEIANLDSGRES